MCIRRTWRARLTDMGMGLYRKISKSFGGLKKVNLYGLGEPLVNPNFLEMVKMARERLPKEGIISFTTNGSLLTPNVTDKLLEVGIDSVFISIDTLDPKKLGYIREGSEPMKIIENLKYLANAKKRSKRELELGIESVLMRGNYLDLPELVERAAQYEVDQILVSNVIPYNEMIAKSFIYTTISGVPLDILRTTLAGNEQLVLRSTYEFLYRVYGKDLGSTATATLSSILKKAGEKGYWLNFPLFMKTKEEMGIVEKVAEVFHRSLKLARQYGVKLRLPAVYPDARKRHCPYVDKNAMVVRSDGKVVPCLEFAYTHPLYVNEHLKTVYEVIFGDLSKEEVDEVWEKEEYVRFRDVRRRFSDEIPWCGDCVYSTQGCFFVDTNEMDCYMNRPSCSECLYSVDLAQCNV